MGTGATDKSEAASAVTLPAPGCTDRQWNKFQARTAPGRAFSGPSVSEPSFQQALGAAWVRSREDGPETVSPEEGELAGTVLRSVGRGSVVLGVYWTSPEERGAR